MSCKRLWICGSLFAVAAVVGLSALYPKDTVAVNNPELSAPKKAEASAITDHHSKERRSIEGEAQAPSPTVIDDSELGTLSDVDIEQKMAGLPTSVDYKKHGEHLRARGRMISEDTLQVYATYTTEVLEELADEGDFAAIEALERRYSMSHSTDYAALNQLREKAAIFGVTFASMSIGHFHLDEAKYIAESEEASRESIVKGLAWLEFTRMRGDLMVEQEIDNALKDPALKVSDADVQYAKTEAKRIYQRLSDQREARGLPEFDDEVSEGAAALYDIKLNGPPLH